MSGPLGAKLGILILVTLAIGLAACGGDDGDETTAPEAANGNARAGAQDLDRFLMRKDEEPGFRPGARPGSMPRSRETDHGRQGVREGHAPGAGRRAPTAQRGVHLVHRPADPRPADGRGHERRPVRDRGRRQAQPGARVAPGRHPRGWPRREPPILHRPGRSRRARLDRVRAHTSATSSGCRVGACSSSETRVPARSRAHCRKARGRSTSAPTGSARSEAGDVVATNGVNEYVALIRKGKPTCESH